MQLGMIGLGRMGANIVRRVTAGGHECVVYDHDTTAVKALAGEDRTTGVYSVAELAEKLSTPRIVWVMVPAGTITQTVIEELANTLESGDIVIDGGNSYYRDDLRHSKLLAEKGIHLLDCGTSGGVWGRERGYCLMIGGDEKRSPTPSRCSPPSHPEWTRLQRTPGRDRRRRATGEGVPALRPLRGGPLRQDGAQRHRVRVDGLPRRGAEHPAQRRHRQTRQEGDAETAPLSNPECYQYDFDIADVAEVWRRGQRRRFLAAGPDRDRAA